MSTSKQKKMKKHRSDTTSQTVPGGVLQILTKNTISPKKKYNRGNLVYNYSSLLIRKNSITTRADHRLSELSMHKATRRAL
jgi:hypothetical protein